jgi:hypothetical protein
VNIISLTTADETSLILFIRCQMEKQTQNSHFGNYNLFIQRVVDAVETMLNNYRPKTQHRETVNIIDHMNPLAVQSDDR